MTRVLILTTPSPLAVRVGEAMGSKHLMVEVKLDHHCGTVYCKPCELSNDTLPAWIPVTLRIWIKRIQREWSIRHDLYKHRSPRT